jgi:hypothetical protein
MHTPPIFHTKQEVFDYAATHLLTQGVRSIDEDYNCLYRGPNNTMCGAGVFIPDELYTPEMERNNIEDLPTRFPVLAFLDEWRFFLKELQRIHDYNSPNKWFEKLEGLAKYENLSTAVLEPFRIEA